MQEGRGKRNTGYPVARHIYRNNVTIFKSVYDIKVAYVGLGLSRC